MVRTIIILAFFLLKLDVYAQEQEKMNREIDSAEVKYVGQFPSSEKTRTRKKINLALLLSEIAGSNNKGNAILNKPMSLFAVSPEDYWVIDQGNAVLYRIKNGRNEIPKAFSKKKYNYQSLVGLCPLLDQGFLFTDSRMNRIYFLLKNQKTIRIFSDSVLLNQPTGIAYNSSKSEIWVVETASHCITLLDMEGKKIRSFGQRGNADGEFNFPTALWIDQHGYAYVLDALNYRVQVFDPEGHFVKKFGEAGDATGFFGLPKSIATDSYGNIYITDALFHVVQIFDQKGRFLYSFGGQGREKGQFWMPSGIFIDQQDNIYVADSYNSRVQLFKLANIVLKNEKVHQ